MKIYKSAKAFLLVLVLGMYSQVFAVQDLKMSYDRSQVSDNFYVPAGGIYVAPNGMFLLFEEQLVQVSMLCSDDRGVFVPGSEMSRQFVWCPICQHWYDPDKPHKCK
ncbi:MAG: hypothetical protein S4CHLAM123_00180 [Chlamydiales bacterium]|nr:hypothetical protein [Chlamydiales bacterium]